VQFFEFQGTPEEQKVVLASFNLEGEANQWWQLIQRGRREGDFMGRFRKGDSSQICLANRVLTASKVLINFMGVSD
jgi:hypothetical protein